MQSYAICTTPRTGSNLLSRMLTEYGAGHPDEWLERRLWHFDTLDEQLRWIRSRNPVAVKLHHAELEQLNLSLDDIIPNDAGVVFLQRQDKLAQARSWWGARKTGRWFQGSTQINVKARELEGLVSNIEAQEQSWLGEFADRRVFSVSYEDLVKGPNDTMQALCGWLGLSCPDMDYQVSNGVVSRGYVMS